MDEGKWMQLLTVEDAVRRQLEAVPCVTDEIVYETIDAAIAGQARQQYLSYAERKELRHQVFQSMREYDVLTPLLNDKEITEIMVNRYDQIFCEKEGKIIKSGISFRSPEKYADVIQQIVSEANRVVNEASPIVDARLKDGSRVNVVLSPISLDGSCLTIRKFSERPLTMKRLVELHSLPEAVAEWLSYLVKSGYNIFISGGTGSGKTTFLNALSECIPKEERIITIEDSAELKLNGIANLVRLEVRNANLEGELAVSMKDLIKASLRMRPDRIIVGEVRSEEALDMLQALNTGHDGSISTGHANSAKDMLTRLETMVLMGFDMPVPALRGQIASALEIIIHLGRLRDHSRKVLEIVEVLQMEEGEIQCQTLFQFQEEQCYHARVQGQLLPKRDLKQVAKLKDAGYFDRYMELMERIKNETMEA